MYITQNIAERIKYRLKSQKKNMKDMLFDLELGINAISEFSKGKQLSCISLAKIADYLDCSVDYLLGRTDVPEINNGNINQHTSDVIDIQIAAASGKEYTPAPATFADEVAHAEKIENKSK